jgi:hypothetical protein
MKVAQVHGTVKRANYHTPYMAPPKLSYSVKISSLLKTGKKGCRVDIKAMAQDRRNWNKRIKRQDQPPNP